VHESQPEKQAIPSARQGDVNALRERANWQVLKVYKDHGIIGAKGRDKRAPSL